MVGQTILHYKILDKLGAGGMGVVYKARDTRLDRTVALKFLPPHLTASDEDKQRFIREAKAAAALNHPHICTIHSVDEHDGTQFIVMEYIDGVTLREKMTPSPLTKGGPQGGLSIDTALSYALQIAEALKEAHSKGIVHRDIKPDNIMVSPNDRIKVMDFGLAKLKGYAQVTQTDKTVGTVTYMSPEQVRGEQVDERSDIWSFGIVLYEMIAGRLPFEGDYEHAIMYSIVNKDPVPLSSIIETIPPELEQVVTRCIAKESSDRYRSAIELSDALVEIRDTIMSAKRVSSNRAAGDPGNDYANKRRTLLAGSVVLVVSLIIIVLLASHWDAVRNWFTTSPPGESIRLTVLPIRNIGGNPSRQELCDGLLETITSNLTKIEQLYDEFWVVPASAVREHNITGPGEVYQTLGVNYAVTGSLQPIADRLRLTINLVDAKNLRQISSRTIDEDASGIMALHDKSVENVLSMLNMEFKSGTREAIKAEHTLVSPAFELYIQGFVYIQGIGDVFGDFDKHKRLEKIDAAIELFELSVSADPQFALAYAGLGRAYWKKYDYTGKDEWLEKAFENGRTARNLDENLAQVNITMGMINGGTGNYEQAIENFKKALSADPTNVDAYRELARVYESLDDKAEAESTIRRSIHLEPDYWSSYNQLGAFYLRHNRYDEGIEQFEKVIELTPDNYIGYMNLGSTYYFLGDSDRARSMYEHALELEKTYDAASNLGTLYYIEGIYAEAAYMYETALEIHDKDYVVWGNLGSAYYWTPGKREKAQPAFERAIELAEKLKETDPNDPYLVTSLAGYRAMLGDEEKARRYATRALEIAPDNTWIMFSAGTTYERIGEREKALHWIGNALEQGYSKSEIINQPGLQDLITDERFQQLIGELYNIDREVK